MAQADLELSVLLSASSAGITVLSHYTQLVWLNHQ
jgi:hypothetical protein